MNERIDGLYPHQRGTIPFGGIRIIVRDDLTERRPYPRSPARAKRRAKMGHPQHYALFPARKAIMLDANTMLMHSTFYEALKARGAVP